MIEKFNNGVHEISNDVYHSCEGLSRSKIFKMSRSPLHYFDAMNKESEFVETPAMVLGELVHTMILEPHALSDRYALYPVINELPKVGLQKDIGKEEHQKQKEARGFVRTGNELVLKIFNDELCGRKVVDREMYNKALSIAASSAANPILESLLSHAKIEHSIFFTHEPTGIQCKVRPDIWVNGFVADLKTSADGSYKAFQSSAYKYGYFLQAAMIKYALESIGEPMKDFIFIVQETKEPFASATYTLDDQALSYGEHCFHEYMAKIKECTNNNHWPTYTTQSLTLPGWAKFEV